jgi:hypothetical protein
MQAKNPLFCRLPPFSPTGKLKLSIDKIHFYVILIKERKKGYLKRFV